MPTNPMLAVRAYALLAAIAALLLATLALTTAPASASTGGAAAPDSGTAASSDSTSEPTANSAQIDKEREVQGEYAAKRRRLKSNYQRKRAACSTTRCQNRARRIYLEKVRAARADYRQVRVAAGLPEDAPPLGKAVLADDGRTAIAPIDAPKRVKDVIAAANKITHQNYRYGGGHASFNSNGYDCSGRVSYALHGGDFLNSPLASGPLERWGSSGKGDWITVYANSGHAWAKIAGLRFDTSRAYQSGSGAVMESGPRWRSASRSGSGFVSRHPSGY